MTPLLSILIPTLPERSASFKSLELELCNQILETGNTGLVEILSDDSPRNEKTIGEKRNYLLQSATGEYVAFVDDDDKVSRNYIDRIISSIQRNHYPDCISLKGVITWNGDWNTAEIFEHSIKYKNYTTNDTARMNLFHWVSTSTADVKYERFPNHLNVVKSTIAKQFTFPHNNFGEDTDWATQIHNSGLIQTEGYVKEVLYHYDYKEKK